MENQLDPLGLFGVAIIFLSYKMFMGNTNSYWKHLSLVKSQSKKMYKEGIKAQDAAKEINLGIYRDWIKPDRVEQAVMKLYNEFQGKGDKSISLELAKGG